MHIETPCMLEKVLTMFCHKDSPRRHHVVQGMGHLLKRNRKISYCGGILDALQRQELCIQHLYVLWVNCK